MKLRRLIMIGGLLALASQTSVAFQEQQGGTQPSEPAAAQPAAPAQLDAPSAPVAKSEGTEVSIPGLGKLGVLPKMDFGLELLYGANQDPPPADASNSEELQDDRDLTIRGSIKKNF